MLAGDSNHEGRQNALILKLVQNRAQDKKCHNGEFSRALSLFKTTQFDF
jgi:hypothetical protein